MEKILSQQQDIPLEPEHPKPNTLRLLLILSLILLLCALGLFIFLNNNKISNSSTVTSQSRVEKVAAVPTPTPMPFVEMTIPYLRVRDYKSKLGELTNAFQGSNYTAYTTFYNSDGLKVNGLLTKPTSEEPDGGFPAIIFIHGYIPPASYKTSQNYYDYVDYLARNGFVVFKIDLRGHGTSEGEAGGGYFSSDYVVDALNAYNALQNSEFINAKKIGFWGHSMAGNIVMRVIASKTEIPAAVIWAGAVYTYLDFAEYSISDSSYQPPPQNSERVRKRQLLRQTHGDPTEDSVFWQQVAPSNYLKDVKGAISIHHAVNDNVVSIKYTRNIQKLLDKDSVTNEVYEYSSGGHNITGASFTEAMQRTVDFYIKYLN